MIGAVTSTTAPAPAPTPGGQLGKEEFLQLLVTQLKHQDPLNPADPQEFAAQLAQFSTLEQLVNIGEQLKAGAASDQALIEMHNATSALSLIGRKIIAEGNEVAVDPTTTTSVQVAVGGSGGNGVVRMYDDTGKEVGSMQLGQLGAGRQTLDLTSLAQPLPAGSYTYEIEVTDANGNPVEAQTYTATQVDGVKYTPNGPVLVCGTRTIALNAVVEISG